MQALAALQQLQGCDPDTWKAVGGKQLQREAALALARRGMAEQVGPKHALALPGIQRQQCM